jgi:hypothetical protein
MKKRLKKSHIAYIGPEFTIEWYYIASGTIPALEYFEDLDLPEKVKTMRLFELIATNGKILNIQKFRNEGNGIYAFKPQPHRFLCFFCVGKKIIVTNAFVKKRDDLPTKEKERAKNYRDDYNARVRGKEYYD